MYTSTYIANFKTIESLEQILDTTEDMAAECVGEIWNVCDRSHNDRLPIENNKFTYERTFYIKEKPVCTIEINGREDTSSSSKYRTIYVDINLHTTTKKIMISGENGCKYNCIPEIKGGLQELAERFNDYHSYLREEILFPKIKKIINNYFTIDRKQNNLEPYSKTEIDQFIETHSMFINEIIYNMIDDYGHADKFDKLASIKQDTIWKYMEKYVHYL